MCMKVFFIINYSLHKRKKRSVLRDGDIGNVMVLYQMTHNENVGGLIL